MTAKRFPHLVPESGAVMGTREHSARSVAGARPDPVAGARPDLGRAGGERGSRAPEGGCLTCADLATTARVLRLLPDRMALVEVGEGTEVVSVALVRAAAGDALLVHAREAIAVVGR